MQILLFNPECENRYMIHSVRRQALLSLPKPPTCLSGSSMNSSVLDTSTKCCRTYLWADLSRSLQECVSANPRMPRQLEGSSWLSRNLQHASLTPLSCSKLAAGSSVWEAEVETTAWVCRTKRPCDTLGSPAAFGPVPERYLPPPRSLLCRRTGPAAPMPEGQCRGGSHGSADSLTSHLHSQQKDEEPLCDFIFRAGDTQAS